MTKKYQVKLKICLFGGEAVGKTSLIKRFVTDTFDDSYLTTIGTKITKKVIELHLDGDDYHITMMTWDIMGQSGFRDLLKESYFFEANGGLAVVDTTRKDTLETIQDWISSMHDVAGHVPIMLLGNKSDLSHSAQVTMEDLENVAASIPQTGVQLTSAKTGEGVEQSFEELARKIIKSLRSKAK